MCLCNSEIRTPWCDSCKSFAYQRIRELEITILDLQSELARKKMSLSVACNRVEELEGKLKIAVGALKRVDNIAYEIDNKMINDIACDALEQIGELK